MVELPVGRLGTLTPAACEATIWEATVWEATFWEATTWEATVREATVWEATVWEATVIELPVGRLGTQTPVLSKRHRHRGPLNVNVV